MSVSTGIAFSELCPCKTWGVGGGGLPSPGPVAVPLLHAPFSADTTTKRGLLPLEESHSLSSLAHSFRIPYKIEFEWKDKLTLPLAFS